MRTFALLCATLLGLEDAGRAKAGDGVLTPAADLQATVESAADGDVIRLSAGRFTATLRIEGKSLTLEGDGGGGTVIEAEYGVAKPVTAGPGSRLILRRIALAPTAKLGGAMAETMLDIQGGAVEAEDFRVEAGAGAVAAVNVENGSARFERASIVQFGTGIGVSGGAKSAIELVASQVDAPFGTAVVLEEGNRLTIEGGFGVRGGVGVVVEGGTPDVHIAAADIAAASGNALRITGGGNLTIYGGRLFAKGSALSIGGRLSRTAIEGVSFYADEGPTAAIDVSQGEETVVSIVRSRFGLKGRPSLGGDAGPAIRIDGRSRLTFSDNLVASQYEAGLLLGADVIAEMSGNVFAAQWGSLLIASGRAGGVTQAEIIVQPMGDELPRDLDARTLVLADFLAADPDFRKRMRDAAAEAAAGSEEAFDRLAVLAEEMRRACGPCHPMEEAGSSLEETDR